MPEDHCVLLFEHRTMSHVAGKLSGSHEGDLRLEECQHDYSYPQNAVKFVLEYEYIEGTCYDKEVDLYETIYSLPNNISEKAGENGSKFSGGQCQRIGIARALYKNTKILIFDEATSALDIETEKRIIKMLWMDFRTYVLWQRCLEILDDKNKSSETKCKKVDLIEEEINFLEKKMLDISKGIGYDDICYVKEKHNIEFCFLLIV